MRIKTLPVILLLAIIVMSGCAGSSSGDGRTPAVPEKPAGAFVTAHYPAFELSVPEGWTERGNRCRLYEGTDAFLLVCPDPEAEGTSLQAQCEQTLAEQLELFYNTDYYAAQVSFDYAEYETDAGERTRVSGTLHNGRTGSELRFSGVYCAEPACCYVYFRDGEQSVTDLGLLREESYESFRAL